MPDITPYGCSIYAYVLLPVIDMPLPNAKTSTKQVDSKGRLTLDRRFANRAVIVREIDATEVVVTIARVIPERETWLYDNARAKRAVLSGLQEATQKQFSEAPDLQADAQSLDEPKE